MELRSPAGAEENDEDEEDDEDDDDDDDDEDDEDDDEDDDEEEEACTPAPARGRRAGGLALDPSVASPYLPFAPPAARRATLGTVIVREHSGSFAIPQYW